MIVQRVTVSAISHVDVTTWHNLRHEREVLRARAGWAFANNLVAADQVATHVGSDLSDILIIVHRVEVDPEVDISRCAMRNTDTANELIESTLYYLH